jgi:hypothetical protein
MMASAETGKALVNLELWHSLVGTLRCYGRDPNLTHGPVSIEEPRTGTVAASCGTASLKLSLDPATGAGEWILESGPGKRSEEGGFELREAGTVRWNSQEMEFDRAAMEWVEWLTRSANRAPARVQEA